MDINEKVKALPNSPGVYLMKGEGSEVLYVGKAQSLKKRVSSYFRPGRRNSERIEVMVSRVRDIGFLPTSTNAEALIYENSLIKQYRPKYNVALRDDKSYPLLKLTVSERYPRLMMTRRRLSDGALYYGPYSSAGLLKEALALMRRIFRLRTCVKIGKARCLNFHIGQCLGPCAGTVDDGVYRSLVEEVRLFLDGKKDELVGLISRKMAEAAAKNDFEAAALLKRKIEALSAVREGRVLYSAQGDLGELRAVLEISRGIDVIEAFDVSNIMGTRAVGSMVSFFRGRPKRSEYKRFRIKTVGSIDDYRMMREIVRRRFTRVLAEKRPLPGLVVIDGGRGHLEVAREELSRLGVDVPIVAIAKGMETIYMEGKEPLILPTDSKALHLLQRIRDEAHRFAITYHRWLMSKGIVRSELDEIRGIGPKRKRALLTHFGSLEKIRKAPKEELLKVRGMDEKTVRTVIDYFNK